MPVNSVRRVLTQKLQKISFLRVFGFVKPFSNANFGNIAE